MECFAHSGAPAVAICRGCGKGVCRACAQELSSGGIACSDRCATKVGEHAAKVAEYDAFYRRSRKVTARNLRAYMLAFVTCFVFGTFFAWHNDYASAAVFFFVGTLFAFAVAVNWGRVQTINGGSKTGGAAHTA